MGIVPFGTRVPLVGEGPGPAPFATSVQQELHAVFSGNGQGLKVAITIGPSPQADGSVEPLTIEQAQRLHDVAHTVLAQLELGLSEVMSRGSLVN